MLNNEKITLMTKLSLYEQKNQKKEIKTSRFFKSDYMLMKMLSSFFYITVAYILALVLWIMYGSEHLVAGLTTTGKFIGIVTVLVLIYIIVTVVYMIFSYAFFSKRFKKIRKNLKEYNGDLKTLHRIQELEYDAIIDELEESEEDVIN